MLRAIRSAVCACFAVLPATGPAAADPYLPSRTIPIPPSPDNPLGGSFATFDISAFDPETRLCYLSDRSNAAIDIFSASTDTFVGRIGGAGHLFAGQRSSGGLSGPNGLLLVTARGRPRICAGNAGSTLLGFDLPPSDTRRAPIRITTGRPDQGRVDEISYDPVDRVILAANNGTPTNFATLVDADPASPTFGTVRHRIAFDGSGAAPAGTGLEASTYNPATRTFFQAIRHIGADPSDPSGLVEIQPRTGEVERVLDLGSARFGHLPRCAPSGVSASPDGRMLIGCSAPGRSIVMDPSSTTPVVAVLPGISGVDQVAFDPTTDRWFLAARDDPGGPAVGVVDAATGALLQRIPTAPGAHSVAVDPMSGDVLVPEGAQPANPTCRAGCIAVYAGRVPSSALSSGSSAASSPIAGRNAHTS